MVDIVKDAPSGFGATIQFMNTVNSEHLQELCTDVMQFLQYKVGAVKTEDFCQKIQKTNKDADITKVKSLVNAIIYLFSAAARNQLSPEDFQSQLDTSLVFIDHTKSCLVDVWSSEGRSLMSTSISQHALGVGQLIDVQWKVGVAMSSDTCRSLNSPFVSLNLTVADASGNLKTHALELTMVQFRNFTNQLKEISNILDTV